MCRQISDYEIIECCDCGVEIARMEGSTCSNKIGETSCDNFMCPECHKKHNGLCPDCKEAMKKF